MNLEAYSGIKQLPQVRLIILQIIFPQIYQLIRYLLEHRVGRHLNGHLQTQTLHPNLKRDQFTLKKLMRWFLMLSYKINKMSKKSQ